MQKQLKLTKLIPEPNLTVYIPKNEDILGIVLKDDGIEDQVPHLVTTGYPETGGTYKKVMILIQLEGDSDIEEGYNYIGSVTIERTNVFFFYKVVDE